MDVFTQPQEPSQNSRSKRKQVAAACVSCQRGKSKCDGDRPSCRRCIQRDLLCEYDVEAGTSRSLSLRRKNDTLHGEINELRELLNQVHNTPEAGAASTSHHPHGSAETHESTTEHEAGDISLQQDILQARNDALSSALESLEFSALSISNLKLRAQPWTNVAGDGLVSELLSSFFAYDNCFYLPFIDRECFLHDMQTGDMKRANFCSPLLVNAICALRCPTSTHAKAFGSLQGFDVQERFLAEAKRFLELECGRRSLTSVQALLIIYTCYVGRGKDRGGIQYRWMAYDMLARLQAKLETRFTDLERTHEGATDKTAKAISRALWGIYCFESVTAFTYLQRSQIEPPHIPRRFLDGIIDPSMTGHSADAEKLHLSAHALNLMCDLSDWMCHAMAEHRDIDLRARTRLYQNLRQWSSESLSLIRADIKFRPEMYGLSMYEDVIALALLLPLDPTLRLPDSLGTPESLCLQHCTRILETSEPYWEVSPADRRSLSDIFPLYHAASIVLVHSPSSQHAHDLFGRAASLLSQYVDDFLLVRYLLQAMSNTAACLRLPLSRATSEMFRRVDMLITEMPDVPIALMLPLPSEIREKMSEAGWDVRGMGIEVGELMSIYTDLEKGSQSAHQ